MIDATDTDIYEEFELTYYKEDIHDLSSINRAYTHEDVNDYQSAYRVNNVNNPPKPLNDTYGYTDLNADLESGSEPRKITSAEANALTKLRTCARNPKVWIGTTLIFLLSAAVVVTLLFYYAGRSILIRDIYF